jgi:hypothetical protein
MKIRRREFLGSVASLSIGAVSIVESQAAVLPSPTAGEWDTSWAQRVTGKYRGVFDSPDFSDGEALYRAMFWQRDYAAVFGTPRQEMSTVLVVRHAGIWLAMSDSFWQKYPAGKRNKFKDDGGHWLARNPIAAPSPGAPPELADMTIPRFIKSGGIVLACNLALKGVTALIKEEDRVSESEADSLAKKFMIPGIILQPSGVFAALHAQELGCHYILAS